MVSIRKDKSADSLRRKKYNLRGKWLVLPLFCLVLLGFFALRRQETSGGEVSISSTVYVNTTDVNTLSTRHGVIVLGMHRSGTSMLSGLLVDGCGYHVGGPLIKAGPANPKGFFELLPAVLQNDAFMEKQRVGWNYGVAKYDNEKARKQYQHGKVLFKRGQKALRFLNNEKSVPYLQKDPRMCLTLPTWLPLLDKEPAVLFTYRHPLEVAMSLKKRETNFGLEHALRLWSIYNMRAIQNSQNLCRVLTSNNAVLRNPRFEVQRISDELTSKCGVTAPPRRLSQDVVSEFVDPELQQQKLKREQQESTERKVIADYEGCLVYEYKSAYKSGRRHDREMNMYRKAMKIYCDLESGKAYDVDYKWPDL